ncbi:MAG: phosphoenolpyruvate synthase [Pseudohongiellaceae bacterium]
MQSTQTEAFTCLLAQVGREDTGKVGGKNASLGEMIRHLTETGIRVPGGFATTADAYWHFLDHNNIRHGITEKLGQWSVEGVSLETVGYAIRRLIGKGEFPQDLADEIRRAYRQLADETGQENPAVAVRSSATAEDLPEASFAGQQESFLNIVGEKALLAACRHCFASLFTDRAIAYRDKHGFEHMKVALSVGVQQMVHADTGSAGVMFSADTESGFPDVVLINANWGLGETVVQGSIDPDEYMVFKPLLDDVSCKPIISRTLGGKEKKLIYSPRKSKPTQLVNTSEWERQSPVLSDDDVLLLSRWAVIVEKHYGCPMDMEWAKDGESGEMFIVQARPETVQSQLGADTFKTYTLKSNGELLVSGLGIGSAIATGKVCKLASISEIDKFVEGSVLVTGKTDPDWVPIIMKAAAIITDHGGRTSHAAIIARELGLPAIVGVGDAQRKLTNDLEITVSCAEGDKGSVYAGIADYESEAIALDDIPVTQTEVMLNLGNPAAALKWWKLPADGIGLVRMEFIISNLIKIHPLALLHPERVSRGEARQIETLTTAWKDKPAYFIDTLAFGLARIAASRHPHPVIVRMSDFKTNEYAQLLGGAAFEPAEENPMLGWRGASRYYSEEYRAGFALECKAVKKAREVAGMKNIVVMIPFCRTPEEADLVLEEMAAAGLRRGVEGLQVYVMAEVPSNIILAEEFAKRFDGFSIGSNDLTQLVLGVDRDSNLLSGLFDDRHEAVRRSIASLITTAHQNKRPVGICGQAPSDYPDFARFLVESGIDSISVNPDSFVAVKRQVAKAESDLL